MSDRNSWINYLLALFSAIAYFFIGYLIQRTQTQQLIALYTFLFTGYVFWITQVLNDQSNEQILNNFALAFRLIFIFSIPNLSEDFYRFIWDGRLLAEGINPFSELPGYYLNIQNTVEGLNQELYQQLNSPEYFTIYPPINQLIFWFAALVGGSSVFISVVAMRVALMAAEVGTYFILPRVLQQLGLPKRYSAIYLLNPLVIIEGVGNIHFEILMFFFIILALWYLKKKKNVLSAAILSLAIGTKLIPLIFLPFLPGKFNFKKNATYYGLTGLFSTIIFLPLLSMDLIHGLQNSLTLYFQKFEFNASIYFLVREIGFQEYGYNRIAVIGPQLAKWTLVFILLLAWIPRLQKPPLITQLMFALGIYLLMATTVHPWYVITLVGLSIFTKYRTPILWSYLIFLTYIGYHESGYELPVWVLFVEYGLVILFFIYELQKTMGHNAKAS